MAQNRVRAGSKSAAAGRFETFSELKRQETELHNFMDSMISYQIKLMLRCAADAFTVLSWVGAGLFGLASIVAELVLSKYGVYPWWGGTALAITLIMFVVSLIVTWMATCTKSVLQGR